LHKFLVAWPSTREKKETLVNAGYVQIISAEYETGLYRADLTRMEIWL